jgi:hypothetical protein
MKELKRQWSSFSALQFGKLEYNSSVIRQQRCRFRHLHSLMPVISASIDCVCVDLFLFLLDVQLTKET